MGDLHDCGSLVYHRQDKIAHFAERGWAWFYLLFLGDLPNQLSVVITSIPYLIHLTNCTIKQRYKGWFLLLFFSPFLFSSSISSNVGSFRVQFVLRRYSLQNKLRKQWFLLYHSSSYPSVGLAASLSLVIFPNATQYSIFLTSCGVGKCLFSCNGHYPLHCFMFFLAPARPPISATLSWREPKKAFPNRENEVPGTND